MSKNIVATLMIRDNCYELEVTNAKSAAAVKQGVRDQLTGGPPDELLELPLEDGTTLMLLRSELRKGHFVIED